MSYRQHALLELLLFTHGRGGNLISSKMQLKPWAALTGVAPPRGQPHRPECGSIWSMSNAVDTSEVVSKHVRLPLSPSQSSLVMPAP